MLTAEFKRSVLGGCQKYTYLKKAITSFMGSP